MANVNKVIVVGNVGREPEMRFTPNGNPVTSFSMAVNNKFTDRGGEKHEETEWFNIVCWNRLAEIVNQYVVKGSSVYVEGRLRTRKWEGQDGQTKYRTEVIANNVQFLGQRPEKAEEGGGPEELEPEDFPF